MSQTTVITASPPQARKFVNPVRMLRELAGYRELIWQYSQREILLRYKGTYLGWVWSVISPLIVLAVYTFVFGFIMKARFSNVTEGGRVEYALTLFCGIIVFNIFSGCISRAPQLITSKPNYVKKVVFPLAILPVTTLISNLVHSGIGFLILISSAVLVTGQISSTIYLFPLVLIPLCAFTLGLGWFLSALGVFVRDMGNLINILLQLLFFMSAVIYPITAIPGKFHTIIRSNPMITIIENARRTLIWGESIEWLWWCAVSIFSLIVMQLGFLWFMKSKRSFADLL